MQETQTLFECKGNITIKATAEYTIHGCEGAFFFQKYTSFSSKSKPKHTKNQNTKSGTGPTWHHADEAANRRFRGRTTSCSLDSGSGTVYG